VQGLDPPELFDPARQALMLVELRRIKALPDLPRDVFEVVEKSLAGPEGVS